MQGLGERSHTKLGVFIVLSNHNQFWDTGGYDFSFFVFARFVFTVFCIIFVQQLSNHLLNVHRCPVSLENLENIIGRY